MTLMKIEKFSVELFRDNLLKQDYRKSSIPIKLNTAEGS